MQCTDGASGARRYQVTPTSNGVNIGDDSFSFMQKNAGEVVMLDPGEGSLHYSYKVIDGDTLTMAIDRRGAINLVTATGPSSKKYGCSADQG